MAGHGTQDQVALLTQRVHALEQDRRSRTLSDAYGRFYAALAVAVTPLVFLPILKPVVEKSDGITSRIEYGTLWQMADEVGGEYAVIGMLLVLGFAGLLATAAVRVRSAGLPAGIAVLAGVLLLMLGGKPGTADPAPDLALAGVTGMVVSLLALVTGAVHAVHLRVSGLDSGTQL